MIDKLRKRMAGDEGFTLIELMVVVIIIGILIAIAVPAYMGMKDRANLAAAKADVRATIPSAEAYYSDKGDYGFTLANLQDIDAGISPNVLTASGSGDSYCISATVGSKSAFYDGPGGVVGEGTCGTP